LSGFCVLSPTHSCAPSAYALAHLAVLTIVHLDGTSILSLYNGLLYWKNKVANKLSSPSRALLGSWARGIEKVLASGELTVLQHNALATKVQNQQKAKYRNRNVL
jgi:hypothetical protein